MQIARRKIYFLEKQACASIERGPATVLRNAPEM
jgi:hypothetical protein